VFRRAGARGCDVLLELALELGPADGFVRGRLARAAAAPAGAVAVRARLVALVALEEAAEEQHAPELEQHPRGDHAEHRHPLGRMLGGGDHVDRQAKLDEEHGALLAGHHRDRFLRQSPAGDRIALVDADRRVEALAHAVSSSSSCAAAASIAPELGGRLTPFG
jgi:hypothetical protein